MSKQILIQHTPQGKRAMALVEGKKLLAYFEEETGIQAEEIYLGKIERQMRGMEAAFVDLGNGLTGFLPYAECGAKPRSGMMIQVQVKKPPVGDKLPYLTADIALAGRYVILTPCTRRFAVSQKITEESLRSALLDAAKQIAPPGMGLILRTESQNAAKEAIEREAAALAEGWRALEEEIKAASAPRLLRRRGDILDRILRDEHGTIDGIVTDRPEEITACPLPAQFAPAPFDLYSVDSQREKLNQRRVWLPCGGYLVIDRTEALWVIDVNSGKYQGAKAGAESTFLKLNLEAAREIARLMRLRAMGGIILVDFVDMAAEESRRAVTEEMQRALQDDPVKCVLHGFTHLGLMELTRKKTETPQGKQEPV